MERRTERRNGDGNDDDYGSDQHASAKKTGEKKVVEQRALCLCFMWRRQIPQDHNALWLSSIIFVIY